MDAKLRRGLLRHLWSLLVRGKQVRYGRDIYIYTDGGCSNGIGGWAWVIIIGGSEKYSNSGGESETTNNRMELTAVIEALEFISGFDDEEGEMAVHTDSQYVKRGITEWIKKWKVNGWKTSDGKPVKNRDLWTNLDNIVGKTNPTFVWVKGHSGIKNNERCDEMVGKEIEKCRNCEK
jgi:ribonuclease HI